MCALLSFPKGEIATRDPLPANNSLVTCKLRLWLGIKCSIGERTFAHVKNDCTKSQKDIKSCFQQFGGVFLPVQLPPADEIMHDSFSFD